MKKLFALTLLIFGAATSIFATETVSTKNDVNPWLTFKEVVKSYHVSTGKFQNLTKEEQERFFEAAQIIKTNLQNANEEVALKKSKHITMAESLFRFVWNSKPELVSFEEIPTALSLDSVPKAILLKEKYLPKVMVWEDFSVAPVL